MLDSGIVRICELVQLQPNGGMPSFRLETKFSVFYGERTVGVTRLYSALGANQKIDALIRVWENRDILVDMFAVMEDGSQFRISEIQHLKDDDGLKVSDLTLEKVGSFYDID